jgi:peptidyl-tRNA hydrolase
VRPVDRYKDENSVTYYVLTKLSFEEMKKVLQQAQELDVEVREYVRKNADRLFKQLEQEEAKRSGGL